MRLSIVLTAILIAVLSLTSTARAQSPVAEIPFRYDYEGWITVSVNVNDQGPYEFIIDSGATSTIVFRNLTRDHEFPFIEGGPRRILGLIETTELPPRAIGKIEAGGIVIDNLTSVVVDNWAPPRRTPHGILGLDFFSPYALEIDPDAMMLRLYERSAPVFARRSGWTSAALAKTQFADSAKPLYVVQARVPTRRYPFIIDLGASGTLINYPALRSILDTPGFVLRVGPATRNRNPELSDLFGNEEEAQLIRIPRIRIGRKTWRNRIVNIYNAKVFEELGVGDEPYGLLGADLLRGRRIILDFPSERLYFGPTVRNDE